MRRIGLIAAAAGIAALVGCSAGSGSPPIDTNPPPSPSQTLAAADGQPTQTAQYQVALDAASQHCTQTQDQLARLALAGRAELKQHGITENALSVLQHVASSASGVSFKMDCVGVLAAYTVLREGPQ